jgi:16S rRNA (uracil1498-N3)-methyltransferase
MKPPRVFVSAPCGPSVKIKLDSEDTHHLRDVLRMSAGDPITVVCDGIAWDANISTLSPHGATVSVLQRSSQASSEFPVEVIVLQALPKGTKMDSVIEKVVELGATRIVPLRCARSYGGESDAKLLRWRRIARAAAQQAQRMIVPAVDQPTNFDAAIAQLACSAHVIVASERARPASLSEAVRRETQKPMALVVGPEGSFTDDELRYAAEAGCDLASLGPTILRTETAATAMIAAIAALRGWW